MSQTRTLTVREAFSAAVRGKSRYTKAFIRDHPGDYPVYSAAAHELGRIDRYDHDGAFLTWATNGYAGFIKVVNGRFSMTADRAALSTTVDGLNLEYAALVLEPTFRAAARGRSSENGQSEYSKLSPHLIGDISFDVPVLPSGELDREEQANVVAVAHRDAAFLLRSAKLSRLIGDVVLLPELPEGPTIELSLADSAAFAQITTSTGWFKREWLPMDTGDVSDYPVYSAAPAPHAYVSAVTSKLISASVERKLVSFAVDGDSSAGSNLVLHDRPFYISNKRTALGVLRDDVLPEYVVLALRSIKADYGFNFNYKAYRAHLQDVVISFPANADGAPDVDLQRAAVREVERLEALQQQAAGLLRDLAAVRIAQTAPRTTSS